jgi:hypothetical protein
MTGIRRHTAAVPQRKRAFLVVERICQAGWSESIDNYLFTDSIENNIVNAYSR